MTLATAPHDGWLQVRSGPIGRWVQLVAGTVVMMAIAIVVFVWPLLQSPPGAELGRSLAAVENAFAMFLLVETLLAPLEGWLGERRRPGLMLLLGLAAVVLGALAGGRAESLRAQANWYLLGGAGAGVVYGGTVARVLKRFTDHKAACVGVTAATCVAALALALAAYATATSAPGAIGALVVIGAGQAVVVLVATLLILAPPAPVEEPPP